MRPAWHNCTLCELICVVRMPPEYPQDYLLEGFRAYSDKPSSTVAERAAQALLRVAVAAAHAAYKMQDQDTSAVSVGHALTRATEEIGRKVLEVVEVQQSVCQGTTRYGPIILMGNMCVIHTVMSGHRDDPQLCAPPPKRQCICPPVPLFHESAYALPAVVTSLFGAVDASHLPVRQPVTSTASSASPAGPATSLASSIVRTTVSASIPPSAASLSSLVPASTPLRRPAAACALSCTSSSSRTLQPFRTPGFGHGDSRVPTRKRRGSDWDIRIADESRQAQPAQPAQQAQQAARDVVGAHEGAAWHDFTSDFAHVRRK